nr:hypothetical protein [Pseudomonas abietaniphila]
MPDVAGVHCLGLDDRRPDGQRDILLTGPWGLGLLRSAPAVGALGMSLFLQLETPDEMRGRVSAVNGLFIGASNQLGEFESGLTAHWLGTVPAVVLGGVGTLAITGLWIKLFPGLAKRDRMSEVVAEAEKAAV